MHSQQDAAFNDSYIAAHRLDRRKAVIDRFYLTSVTNRAFNEYFGNVTYGCLTEFVNPGEKESFIEFIDGFDGVETEKCFLFKNGNGEYRLNLIKLIAFEGDSVLRNIDIEMLDIDSIVETNYKICDDIARERLVMGLTGEYVFTYSGQSGDIKIVRYEGSTREVRVRMPLDEWREYMADGIVVPEDIIELDNLVNCMKTYMSDFCVKLTTSMRTMGKVNEKVKFIGTIHTKYTGENIVTGRIVLADGVNSMGNIVEVVDELTMDSLTKVYNKKTITEYAVLARVAKKLKEVVGEDGIVGRIGGDEFMIVLKGINDDYALRGVLRAIRTQVKWEFKNDYENFQVTTSIGVAFSPNNGHEYEELFKKADFCLYVAKEKGRDRYVFFRDEMHREAYENSINKKDKIINDGREMRELRYLTDIMIQYNNDKKAAVMAMLEHMQKLYKVDNISIYEGKDLVRKISVGTSIEDEDMSYVYSDGFKRLMGDKTYIAASFVNNNRDVAPEFADEMRKRHIYSTIHCLIGSKDEVKGMFTVNRMKAASQWAEYEIECSVITATLVNMLMQ